MKLTSFESNIEIDDWHIVDPGVQPDGLHTPWEIAEEVKVSCPNKPVSYVTINQIIWNDIIVWSNKLIIANQT